MATYFSRHRLTWMRVVAFLAGAFFVMTLPQAISPWGSLHFGTGVRAMPLHRWAAALAGIPDLGSAVVLFYLAWRPLRAPIALQSMAIGALIFLGANAPFVPRFLTWAWIAIPVILVVVLYPRPRDLLALPWSGGVSLPLLALGALVALLMLSDAAHTLVWQIRNYGVLAPTHDLGSNAEHLTHLGVLALLAAMNRPGARFLGLVAGTILAFLGAAALAVPNDPGSWGTLGGGLAIVLGLALDAVNAWIWWRHLDHIRMARVADLPPVGTRISAPKTVGGSRP